MLKLNASYSKKVPAEGEYSSKSYHAAIEVELPDSLNQDELQDRIHATFALVRESVEAELNNKVPSGNENRKLAAPPRNPVGTPASPKQINYLLTLGRNLGLTPQQVAAKCNVGDLKDLSKQVASQLINEWRIA